MASSSSGPAGALQQPTPPPLLPPSCRRSGASGRRRRRPGEAPQLSSMRDALAGAAAEMEEAPPIGSGMWPAGGPSWWAGSGSSNSDSTRRRGRAGAGAGAGARAGRPPPWLRTRRRRRWWGGIGGLADSSSGRLVLGLLALLLLHQHQHGALAFSPHQPPRPGQHRGPPTSSPQPPQPPSTAPPPSSASAPVPPAAAAASAAAAYGGAFAPYPPSPPAATPLPSPPATTRRPTASTAAALQQRSPRLEPAAATAPAPPIPGRRAEKEERESAVGAGRAPQAPTPEEALEATLAAAGAWAGGWGGRRASLALHELACVATDGRSRSKAAAAVAALVGDPRFGRLLGRLEALAASEQEEEDFGLCPLDVATALQALGRLAGHMPRALAAATAAGGGDTPGALRSLASALLARTGARRASLSGRDLSGALHAAGKLAGTGLLVLPSTSSINSTSSLQLLATEALSPRRFPPAPSSSSHTAISTAAPLALTPRDAAQALTGIAQLQQAAAPLLLLHGLLPPTTVAAAAEALAGMAHAHPAGRSSSARGWDAQDVVGVAEGAAALARASCAEAEEADAGAAAAEGEQARLALEGLASALVARAGGGAAVRGPPRAAAGKHAPSAPGVTRLWRPCDRRRVAAALAAVLLAGNLAPAPPTTKTPSIAAGVAGAPERWLLRARVRAAPSPAALQALLLPSSSPPAASPTTVDGVALAMGVQRLGRLCAGRRREQAAARAWLLPYLERDGGAAAAAVEGMDGRALASLLDGLAMLAAPGYALGGPLAAAVDAAMDRALLRLPLSPAAEAGRGGDDEEGHVLPHWLLAPDAARLFPALVKLQYGLSRGSDAPHRRRLLRLAQRRAAAGAAALPLPVVGRLLHATATATAAAAASGPSQGLFSTVASAALLRRGAALLLLSRPPGAKGGGDAGAPKDLANLVAAAAALAEATTTTNPDGDQESSSSSSSSGTNTALLLADPLAALARPALAWEARRGIPEGGLTALDLAKLLGGLARLLGPDEAGRAAPRWLARARALLPDARLRALAAVAGALVRAVGGGLEEGGGIVGGVDREALRAFVADARRRLPALALAARVGLEGDGAGIGAGVQEAEAEARAALAALEAAAAGTAAAADGGQG